MTLVVDPAPAPAAAPAARRRLSTRARWTAVGTAGAAVVVASAGVYALLSATAFNPTPQQVDSGTLTLELADAGAGFSTPLANLAPGDVVKRHVTLTSTGSLVGEQLTLKAVDATPTVLSTDATRGLQVAVSRCSQAWDATTGTCAGSASPVGTVSLASLVSTPLTLVPGTVAAGEALHLQLQLTLPDSTEVVENGVLATNTVQGRSAQLTWTFTVGQRAGTTTSG